MSATSEIRAGEAFVEVSAKYDKLDQELNAAGDKIKNFADRTKDVDISLFSHLSIEAAMATIKTATSAAVSAFMGYGDQFEKMSQRIGMGIESSIIKVF